MTELCAATVAEAENVIPAFQVVSPTVLRGGQPDQEGLELLHKAGVKLIVNLRFSSKSGTGGSTFFRRRGDDDEIDEEKAIAEKLGMKFVNISLDGINTPSVADLSSFVDLFSNTANLPLFVHCLYGKERTSLMVACYRVKMEGWSANQAYKEMLQTGLDPSRTVLSDALFTFAG